MTPESAWAEAMKFENRPNPYRFFDELRKTPVARVADGLYVVTGYRELMALAHDPRISSDTRRLKAQAAVRAGAESDPSLEAYGEHGSMINSDPPETERISHARFKEMMKEQFLIVLQEPERAVAAIPTLLPAGRGERNSLLGMIRQVAILCDGLGTWLGPLTAPRLTPLLAVAEPA